MNLIHFKKKLRTSQTDTEKKLWWYLKNRNMHNQKFRRQHIIKNFIVDFVCLEKNLIIELDGSQHLAQSKYDIARTQLLIREGFNVLRFWNNEVIENIESVLEVISQALSK